jgi:hypothetical protein
MIDLMVKHVKQIAVTKPTCKKTITNAVTEYSRFALYRNFTVWSVPGIQNSKKIVTPLVPMWQE